jgi:spermidine synthase
MKTKSLTTSLLMMGLSGIAAQILLLRELLVSFSGNELTLGIILGNWLILVAIGSFIIGKTVEKVERKIEVYASFQLFFSAALPFTIYLSRVFKNILLITPGEGLGFFQIFYSSFLILLPVTLPQGSLFTYGCKLYSQYVKKDVSSIGRVYALESIGAIVGGLLMTFLFIQYLNSFEIAFIISLTNSLIPVFLLSSKDPSILSHHRSLLRSLSLVLTVLFACILFSPLSNKIHSSSIQSQWKQLNVIHNENSIYGNITVTRRGEQFTFFNNGVPSITTPVPDIASIEDFVHFPMLFHKRPESVLILSGGAGGMIHEILKYPVSKVDYVELDPLLLKLIQKFPTPLTQSELSDRRVMVHYDDSRFFVQRTKERFDIIFVGLHAPQELQTNRLFSSEFFSTAKGKMNSDGIIVLSLPGSLTYISLELRDLNGCIFDTLKSVFRSVRVIPGEINLYLASDSDQLERVATKEVMKRFEEREIKASQFTQSYIEYRLDGRWLKWFFQSIDQRGIRLNSDFHPIGVFLSLSYWNALFSPYLTGIIKWFEGFSLQISIVFLALFTLSAAVILIMKPQLAGQSIPYVIFTTGFVGMIFNLSIIFIFQVFYGYLYRQMGLLIALFMSGVALSSLLISQRLDRIKRESFLLLKIEIVLIFFSFLFPFIFSIPFSYLENTAFSGMVYGLFLMMSFVSGAWIGLQFPLSTKISLMTFTREETVGRMAGLLYGADLLGGFLAGVFGGVLLLPILGLKGSCFLIGMVKISSLALLLIFIKLHRAK